MTVVLALQPICRLAGRYDNSIPESRSQLYPPQVRDYEFGLLVTFPLLSTFP